jgi:hypothetical protein
MPPTRRLPLALRGLSHGRLFPPTVIQPAIPAGDITPLERLLLSHIFVAEPDGDSLYFYADERPADMIWVDRAPIEAALAQSKTAVDSTAVGVVTEQLARVPADNVEIELDLSGSSCWESIFQDIVRRSVTLRYVTAVSAFTCSRMRPDGFGGMAVLITPSAVIASRQATSSKTSSPKLLRTAQRTPS